MRRILIVGNSDGIGAAVAELLISRGDAVFGLSRSASPLVSGRLRHEVVDVVAPDYADMVARMS